MIGYIVACAIGLVVVPVVVDIMFGLGAWGLLLLVMLVELVVNTFNKLR